MSRIPFDGVSQLMFRLPFAESDIMFAWLASRPLVVIGTAKAAMELLDNRAQNYSDRGSFVLLDL